MKFKSKLKGLEFLFYILIILLYLFFSIYSIIIGMYSWAIYCGIGLFLSITFCFVSLKLNAKFSVIMIVTVFTLILLLNILFFGDIFPINYLWLLILITFFSINYKILYLFFYILFLWTYIYKINDFSIYVRTKMNIDLYYLPSKDVVLVNNIFHIIAMLLTIVSLYYFYKEKKRLKVKNWTSFINEEVRLMKIRDIQFITTNENLNVFENELEELYFKIKSFLENQKPYKNPDYNISNISKELAENSTKIIKALEYQNHKINFDDLLNYYRIKDAKKLLLTNELILEDIYSNVGFKNHKKFVTTFTYFEGISPEEFIFKKLKNYSAMV